MSKFDLNKIPSQKGHIAIVTGANVGLGYETTRSFVKKDLKVIMACRNLEKAEEAKRTILIETPNAELEIQHLDLGKLESVRNFAKEFSQKYDRLDLLVNNAGIMIPPYSLTEDGFESQFGVNYLGHFLLTGLLLPLIEKTSDSRIVTLSSNAHKSGEINFDDLQFKKKYSAITAYSQSKLACLMFTYELDRRLRAKQSDTISVAAHPGVSNTNLGQYVPKILQWLAPVFMLFMGHSPDEAAKPTVMAALYPSVEGGDYYGPSGRGEWSGDPEKVDSTARSKDKEIAKKLWQVSAELTSIEYLN